MLLETHVGEHVGVFALLVIFAPSEPAISRAWQSRGELSGRVGDSCVEGYLCLARVGSAAPQRAKFLSPVRVTLGVGRQAACLEW